MDGKFYLSPKYANKPLELTKGKPSIAYGEAIADVLEVLNSVHEATVAGELDRVRMPKADLPLPIYDQTKAGTPFTPRLTIS